MKRQDLGFSFAFGPRYSLASMSSPLPRRIVGAVILLRAFSG